MGRPSKYTPEFPQEAVRLHGEQGASVAESARTNERYSGLTTSP